MIQRRQKLAVAARAIGGPLGIGPRKPRALGDRRQELVEALAGGGQAYLPLMAGYVRQASPAAMGRS